MSNPNHEEELYAQAAAELEDGNRDEGLWAKCFAECDGEENKAKARYIKTRAERLAVVEKTRAERSAVYEIEVSESNLTSRAKHTDIGGWLAFLCVGLLICRPCGGFAGVGNILTTEENLEGRGDLDAILIGVLNIGQYGLIALSVFSFACGLGLMRRRNWALGLTKAHLMFSAGFAVLMLLLAIIAAIDSGWAVSIPSVVKGVLVELTFCGIWYAYLLKSKRVSNTEWLGPPLGEGPLLLSDMDSAKEREKELPASEGREFQKRGESYVDRINREYDEEKRKGRSDPNDL